MPEIGEIASGKEISTKSLKNNNYIKYVWQKCLHCEKERWVRLEKGIPRTFYCLKCSLGKGSKNHSWKGGRSQDSKGYMLISVLGHPRASKHGNYVYEQIVVWETAKGRAVPDGWVIHHLNGIKDDNELANLVAIPRGNHHHSLILQGLQKRIRELEVHIKRLECQGALL